MSIRAISLMVVALFAVCHRDERIIEYAEVQGTQQSDLARPQRIQEAETVAMGRLIAVVSPEYPEEAKQQHSTGKVVLKILIDTAGQVKEASLLTGDPLLADATVTAVKQWKFLSFSRNQEQVEVETTATVEYTADPPYVITPKPIPRKLRVSQGVSNSNLLEKVQPVYPLEARADHIQGDVILQVTISKEGKVTELKLISGPPVLVEAAMDAVRQWTFKPYTLNGQPVEVETTIKVQFQM